MRHGGSLLRAGAGRAAANAGDGLGAAAGVAAKAMHIAPELGNVRRMAPGFRGSFQSAFRDALRTPPVPRDLSAAAPAPRAPGWHASNPAWAEGPGAELNGPSAIRGQSADIQQAGRLNPDILKQAKFMKQSQLLGLAFAVQDNMQKQATAALLERGLGSLRGLASKAAPAVNKGFSAIGEQANKLPPEGLAAKLLVGEKPPVGPAVATAGDVQNSFGALGKQVAGRTAAGAGIAGAGVLAAEAPFKAINNEQVEEQQQHPIKTWLAQHLQGKQPLQHKSYLNPLAV